MGRWKALIPFLIAVIIAGAGGVMLYQFMQRSAPLETEEKAEVNTVEVMVAAVDINRGTKIDGDMIKTARFIKETLPAGTFDGQEKLSGRVAITSLKLNEPVMEYKLAPLANKSSGLAAIIPVGKRAMAVKGDRVMGLSGLIKADDLVDVFVTTKNPDPDINEEFTKLVLDKVPVLATDTQMVESKDGAQPVNVYTLEVTPQDGEKLALASNEGTLQFALRNYMDKETVLTKGATISETLASLTDEKPDPEAKSTRRARTKTKQRMHTVRVIRNGQVVEQKFPY